MLAACAGLVFGLSPAAFAQRVIINDSGWTLTPAGGAVPNPYSAFRQNGTGNSAPVAQNAGTLALVHQYAADNVANFDGQAVDHRVMKAVLIGGATKSNPLTGNLIKRTNANGSAGDDWAQETAGALSADPTSSNFRVRRSLDPQLGGGLLDARNTLRQFASREVRQADNATGLATNIDASAYVTPARGSLFGKSGWWDRQTVQQRGGTAAEADKFGTVNYLLGDLAGSEFRVALSWDAQDNGAGGTFLPRLEMKLWYMNGLAGNGATPGLGDFVIASTVGGPLNNENVRLFDFVVPDFDKTSEFWTGQFVLQIVNAANADVIYGLSVQVPGPGGAMVLLVGGVFAARRRRV
jgi:hypothetical protein